MKEIINSYDILIKRLNENIRGLKAHPKILDQEENKYLYPFFENAMYIAISASDLIIGLKYLDVSNIIKNGVETNYFARNVALISYELINHHKKMISQDVSKIIIDKCGVDTLNIFKSSSKKIKDINNQYFKKLNFIRNNLFGHRTPNGSEMINSMLDIDTIEIYKIGKQLFDIYLEILKIYTNLLGKL